MDTDITKAVTRIKCDYLANSLADMTVAAGGPKYIGVGLISISMAFAQLTEAERNAFESAMAYPEIDDHNIMVASLWHDLNGLSNRDVCFLPRIRSIADVAEWTQ